MGMFPRLSFKKKPLDDKKVTKIIRKELDKKDIASNDGLQFIITKVEEEKRRREIWNRLPMRKKIQLARYVKERRNANE